MRVRALRRLPIAYGLADQAPDRPDAVTDGWVRPFLEQRGVRRDTASVLRGTHRRDTAGGGRALRRFDRPALIAWAREDRSSRSTHAHRLAAILPQGARRGDRRQPDVRLRGPARAPGRR